MMLDFGFYNMDCMDGMAQFPDKYFDLAIVDPPYDMGYDYVGFEIDEEYYKVASKRIAEEMAQIRWEIQ